MKAINLANLPEPVLPAWAKKKITANVARDILSLEHALSFSPAASLNHKKKLSARSIFDGISNDQKELSRHAGLKALLWIEQNWTSLSSDICMLMEGKMFYGFADVVEGHDGHVCVPYLTCRTHPPRIGWHGLAHELGIFEHPLILPTLQEIVDSSTVLFAHPV